MANLGTLRDYKLGHEADDIRGAKLYGRNDDKLGTIEDVVFDNQSGDIRYAVIDTGGWLTHKRFLVPAGRIQVRGDGSYADEMDYQIDMSKPDIERLPKYDPDAVRDDERWKKYEKSYREVSDSGVMHQAGSANIITEPGTPPRAGADDLPPINEDLRLHRQFSNRTAGPMNTGPLATGDTMETDRLTLASEDSVTQPDLRTTSTSLDEGENEGNRNSAGRNLNRVESTPFKNADVGAAGSASDRLEQNYTDKEKGQPLPGEFVDAPSAADRNWTAANRSKTSDAEFRTAEGDSIFNAADNQEKALGSQSSGVAQDLSKGSEGDRGSDNLGSRVGNRWSRFQGRLRDERANIAAHHENRSKDAA